MPLSYNNHRRTLTQFLIEERRRFPSASGDFNALILDVAIACKAIARAVAFGELGGVMGNHAAEEGGSVNGQGETQKKLDVLSNDVFIRRTEWAGNLVGMASEEMDVPYQIRGQYPRGKYLLVFDPLDGSSNIDVNVSVGSIFSVLRAPQDLDDMPRDQQRDVTEADFFQPGAMQVAAGYALYGPTTMLVLTVGDGVNGFTLDPTLGEFMLTHPHIQIPVDTHEFAINASNARFWEAPVKRYVDECLAGKSGPRAKDFIIRWIASMVAEAHPAACACCTKPIRSACSWNRPEAAPPPARCPCWACNPPACTSALVWCLAPKMRWSASSVTTPSQSSTNWTTPCLPSAACFATHASDQLGTELKICPAMLFV